MPRTETFSDADKVRLFRDSVYYEIIHTFGVPADLSDEQLDSHAIGETINFSRHVHARALAHFLFRRPSDNDVPNKGDAFAEDFGFNPATELQLTDADRKNKAECKDLNKGLVHITYGRVRGATTKPWTSTVLNDLLPVAIQFMKHIRDKERVILVSGTELFVDQQERGGWAALLACLEQCQQGQRLRFESGFNGPRTWYKPTTQNGSIAALYAEKPKAAPPEAVYLSSATNTADPRYISIPPNPHGD